MGIGWEAVFIVVLLVSAAASLFVANAILGLRLDRPSVLRTQGPGATIDAMRAVAGVAGAIVLTAIGVWVVRSTDWSRDD